MKNAPYTRKVLPSRGMLFAFLRRQSILDTIPSLSEGEVMQIALSLEEQMRLSR